MLAEGLSGAAIAERLVLSPETVRTHVRNAMDKLGASTRSQAVALALEDGQIGDSGTQPATATASRPPTVAPSLPPTTPTATLTALLSGVAALADVDAATIYFAQEGGLALSLGAHASSAPTPTPAPKHELTLGEGSIGRVALERRARLVSAPQSEDHPSGAPMLVTPMVSGGRLTGILCLEVRSSRPTSRRELLLLEAFGNRVADILAGGGDLTPALRSALQRFRASWTGTLEG
jgi:Bacterial regulatory proteins, luxR family/GAF domain